MQLSTVELTTANTWGTKLHTCIVIEQYMAWAKLYTNQRNIYNLCGGYQWNIEELYVLGQLALNITAISGVNANKWKIKNSVIIPVLRQWKLGIQYDNGWNVARNYSILITGLRYYFVLGWNLVSHIKRRANVYGVWGEGE